MKNYKRQKLIESFYFGRPAINVDKLLKALLNPQSNRESAISQEERAAYRALK